MGSTSKTLSSESSSVTISTSLAAKWSSKRGVAGIGEPPWTGRLRCGPARVISGQDIGTRKPLIPRAAAAVSQWITFRTTQARHDHGGRSANEQRSRRGYNQRMTAGFHPAMHAFRVASKAADGRAAHQHDVENATAAGHARARRKQAGRTVDTVGWIGMESARHSSFMLACVLIREVAVVSNQCAFAILRAHFDTSGHVFVRS